MSDIATPCKNPLYMDDFHADDEATQRKAAGRCIECPLMVKCEQQGRTEPYGVWGGVTEFDRPEAKDADRQRLANEEAADRRRFEDQVDRLTDEGHTREQIAVILRSSVRTVARARSAANKRRSRAAALTAPLAA